MNALIVYAHPEPRSFNASMRDVSITALREAGHDVVVSDLYAMKFNPAGGPRDFDERADASFFRYQREQRNACANGGFAREVAAEIDKVVRADVVILQFPLWWYSLPAILKGWVDRVFAMGFAYDVGRAHEAGPLRGKRAMVSLTTGGPAASFAHGARNQPIDDVLYHIQYGMLHFAGMDVLPPFVAFGAVRATDEQRAAYLDALRERMRSIHLTEPLEFVPGMRFAT
jgi:NAD(P)H dehydrogenase (quinone)